METQTKIDLYKLHRAEYAASKKPALVRVEAATYLAINGKGTPGGNQFTASIGALYGMAFTIKMTRKFAGLQDYAVCKLEAIWWHDSAQNFTNTPREEWQWELLIRTPDFIKKQDLECAIAALSKRGKAGEEVKQVALESITEGTCVQMLHLGPYEKEPESVAKMKEFAEAKQLALHGKHHEIYLSDPRRVPPERLKTVLRIPITATEAQ